MPRKRDPKSEEFYEPFPTKLRDIMEEQLKTQQDVADAIGKTRQAIGYYADGSSSPDWKTIVRLAQFFGVSTDWLLGISDARSTDEDVKVACKYTGLSEEAIKITHSLAGAKLDGEGDIFNVSFVISKILETLKLHRAAQYLFNAIKYEIGGYSPILFLQKGKTCTETEVEYVCEMNKLSDEVREIAEKTGQVVIDNEEAKEFYVVKAKDYMAQAINEVFDFYSEEISSKFKGTTSNE